MVLTLVVAGAIERVDLVIGFVGADFVLTGISRDAESQIQSQYYQVRISNRPMMTCLANKTLAFTRLRWLRASKL